MFAYSLIGCEKRQCNDPASNVRRWQRCWVHFPSQKLSHHIMCAPHCHPNSKCDVTSVLSSVCVMFLWLNCNHQFFTMDVALTVREWIQSQMSQSIFLHAQLTQTKCMVGVVGDCRPCPFWTHIAIWRSWCQVLTVQSLLHRPLHSSATTCPAMPRTRMRWLWTFWMNWTCFFFAFSAIPS